MQPGVKPDREAMADIADRSGVDLLGVDLREVFPIGHGGRVVAALDFVPSICPFT